MLFYYSQSLIFLLSTNGLDILQLLQNLVSIHKSTRYFATCTKNRPDILLSKNRPDIFKVVQKSTRYFAAKKSSRFLVENRPIKSMHNFETNGAPQFTVFPLSLFLLLFFFSLAFVWLPFPSPDKLPKSSSCVCGLSHYMMTMTIPLSSSWAQFQLGVSRPPNQ